MHIIQQREKGGGGQFITSKIHNKNFKLHIYKEYYYFVSYLLSNVLNVL